MHDVIYMLLFSHTISHITTKVLENSVTKPRVVVLIVIVRRALVRSASTKTLFACVWFTHLCVLHVCLPTASAVRCRWVKCESAHSTHRANANTPTRLMYSVFFLNSSYQKRCYGLLLVVSINLDGVRLTMRIEHS